MREPLIVQYINLLYKYKNPDAKKVKRFLNKHSDDSIFIKRACVFNRIFKLKGMFQMEKNWKRKFWLWLKSVLFYRCPKCGGHTNDCGYGEYCKDVDNCKWMRLPKDAHGKENKKERKP